MYKLFDSCKFDKKWERIETDSGPGNKFKSIDDHAAIKIQVQGVDPESYHFKKHSIINIKNGIIQYQNNDLVNQS